MSESRADQPFWRRPSPEEQDLAHQADHMRRRHLLLDPRFPWDVDADVLDPMYRTGRVFWLLTVVLGGLAAMWFATWLFQMYWGIGVTGLNRPVEWALYIVNFVYFIGIGHAGTFISAALRVLKIEWRRPISRVAETLTLFALLTAALFPLVHPLSQSTRIVAELPLAADLGHDGHLHLPHRQRVVRLPRSAAGLGHGPRSHRRLAPQAV
jgi:hypothetical protein